MNDFAKRLAKKENTPLLLDNKFIYPIVHLTKQQKFSFGLGHVINDVSSALWFSYALIFLQIIVNLQPTVSASLFFVGQLVDSVATPFIGVLIDKYSTKKKWNALGVILIVISFPFIFHVWKDISWRIIPNYAFAIIIFQVGWATIQISHLSLIPEMTALLEERADLTTLRYVVYVCSNIVIYVMAFFILQESKINSINVIEPSDSWKFEVVAILAVFIGIFCSITFQYLLRTPPIRNKNETNQNLRTWKKFSSICCSPNLFLLALIYTSSRMFQVLNFVYIPFFINETNVRNSGILALAPFFSFIASLIVSLGLNFLGRLYCNNNKVLFTAGTLFSLLNCVSIYLNPDEFDDSTFIYIASVLCGIGSTMTIITSLCIIANFIGSNVEHSGLIYGIITFLDKIFNGIFIFIIEYVKYFDIISQNHYYKFILTFVNGVITVSGFVFLMILPSSVCYSI